MVKTVFCHYQSVHISKPYMSVVFLHSGLYRLNSLSNVHLATLIRYAVNPWSPQFQAVLQWVDEDGNLPHLQANTFDVFGQHLLRRPCCLDIWKKSDWGGPVFQLQGSNGWAEGTYLLETLPIFPWSGLEELQLIMRLSLSPRALCALRLNVQLVCWKSGDVI